ncbi:M24 family metallopeptidase [Chengkuizengella axinellae]|uniref:Xaa-Pro peptidase family protein n=1 Tax=Chengkuizengella axinellae TaxID=3064388 RepID=A0ABT9J5W0_9BACL|nr:Xaa-Pro peptidase family protein [Chengkuizengella sp. 2205SS18-9]MDP5277013.1 Xaa-Pro peptidase family protein [Chengkuizengella sp. 2205SS18-9]
MSQHLTRQNKLQQKIKENGIQGYLVSQNVDIFYLTGSMQTGYLFIPVEGEPVFYVRRSVQRAQEESSCTVKALGSFRNFGEILKTDFPQIFNSNNESILATEFDVLPIQIFNRLQSIVPNVKWKDGSVLIREIRMIKSSDEISMIKTAARAVDQALQQALGKLKAGMTEVEWMSEIEYYLRLQGHFGLMRMRGFNQELVTGMVAAGIAAAKPTYFDGPAGGEGLSPANPQGSGKNKINRNEPVLVDLGCCIDGYVIDQTRTVVIGELSKDLVKAYQTAEHILKSTEAMLKPGTLCEDLYFNALELAEGAGLKDHFMGYGADQVKFLGHGIGMEIDEYPVLAKGFKYALEPGMVIAIEPKFTFPESGVVGIEDTYLITENGFEKLTVTRDGVISVTS